MEFPENWIITCKGELVELGNDFETPWGFTIQGIDSNLEPNYGFCRNWKSIDHFLKQQNDR